MDDEKGNLPWRLGGHEREDPASLASAPEADAVRANVVTGGQRPRTREHVGRENGEVGLLPVATRLASAALVVA